MYATDEPGRDHLGLALLPDPPTLIPDVELDGIEYDGDEYDGDEYDGYEHDL